jgi:hypothetical protein
VTSAGNCANEQHYAGRQLKLLLEMLLAGTIFYGAANLAMLARTVGDPRPLPAAPDHRPEYPILRNRQ